MEIQLHENIDPDNWKKIREENLILRRRIAEFEAVKVCCPTMIFGPNHDWATTDQQFKKCKNCGLIQPV